MASLLQMDLADAVKILAFETIRQYEQVTIVGVVKDFQNDNTPHTRIQTPTQQAAQRWHTCDTAKLFR
jgi:argonaute-like protein implicated in RNA metabolism and viral defense